MREHFSTGPEGEGSQYCRYVQNLLTRHGFFFRCNAISSPNETLKKIMLLFK
jgi:hypothetical protein